LSFHPKGGFKQLRTFLLLYLGFFPFLRDSGSKLLAGQGEGLACANDPSKRLVQILDLSN
jgi:hypothetical protein